MRSLILIQQEQQASRKKALQNEATTRALRESRGRKRAQRRLRGLGRLFGNRTRAGLAGSPPGAGGRLLQL